MSDFDYDTYDVSTMKVAFANLRKAEQQGFWLGLLAGSPLGVWLVSREALKPKFTAGPATKVCSALVVGSLIYGAWIFKARHDYKVVAGKVNRKYSVLLNKAMTYS